MSAKNIEINGPINIEMSETDEKVNFNTDEKKENVIKPDEDEQSNQAEANENDGEKTQKPNCSLEEDQVSIEDDDDNDLTSPKEVSREESAQSAKSRVFSPLDVSSKVVSMLVAALPTSKKSRNSERASRLSS